MDLNYSAEELAFRDQMRAWLDANLPDDLRRKVADYESEGRKRAICGFSQVRSAEPGAQLDRGRILV